MQPAIFLDRDGVINRALVRGGRPYAPTSLREFEILPGAAESIAALREAGYRTIVVTNQPDVATGKADRQTVTLMHLVMLEELGVDDVFACFHTDADDCGCRKPKAGMLLEAAEKWNISLAESFLVGDRWRDVGAGKAAGCKTIFIDAGYAEPLTEEPDWTVASLAEAGRVILSQTPMPAQGGAAA